MDSDDLIDPTDRAVGASTGQENRGHFVVGELVTAHVTARLAIELVASAAGDEERTLGNDLLRRLGGDSNGVIEYPAPS